MTLFSALPIHPVLLAALQEHGYTDATAVQEAIVTPEHATGDLIVSSRTGSGKTIGFGLGFSQILLGELPSNPEQHKTVRVAPCIKPRVLVVAPTRELALQVAQELTWLYRGAGVVVTTCVGGMDIRREQYNLVKGAHIVVGTPGRLCDHLDRGSLLLEDVSCVVLDEADEMLDMGFREELELILDGAETRSRMLLFSATMPREIEMLAKKYTKNAKRIIATPTQEAHQDISYIVHVVAMREREAAVVNLLRYHNSKAALVFCATREGTAMLHKHLSERGFTAVSLSGELNQMQRSRALQAMRDNHARVLVATDVAARGLDLPDIGLVVHADLPQDPSVLQHRSGRTGRAGQKGTAVLLVPTGRERGVDRALQNLKIKATKMPVPTIEEIQALDGVRLGTELEESLAEIGEITDSEKKVVNTLLANYDAATLIAGFVRKVMTAFPQAEDLPLTAEILSEQERQKKRAFTDRLLQGSGAVYDERVNDVDEAVWFRVNVGRVHRADPKWILPMLCRRGKVRKADIGRMEIRRADTEFAIPAALAESFAKSACAFDSQDPNVFIERADGMTFAPQFDRKFNKNKPSSNEQKEQHIPAAAADHSRKERRSPKPAHKPAPVMGGAEAPKKKKRF